MSNETVLILNPASASGRTGRNERSIVEQIEARLGGVERHRTGSPGEARALAHAATVAGARRLLVGGGDGTLNEIVDGVMAAPGQRRPTLGLLPLGSGGDFARSLGLPRELGPALEVIEVGHSRRVDLGRLEYCDTDGSPRARCFANEASAGLSGATIGFVGRFAKRLGARLGFAAGAVAAIATHRPEPMSIEIDGRIAYEGPVSMVVAANGGWFGAGMRVAPGARPDDGDLEVVLVRGLSVPRLLVNLPSLLSGRHGAHPSVSFYAARSVRVVPKQAPSLIDLDGEAVGLLPMRAEVLPGKLDFFAPRGLA